MPSCLSVNISWLASSKHFFFFLLHWHWVIETSYYFFFIKITCLSEIMQQWLIIHYIHLFYCMIIINHFNYFNLLIVNWIKHNWLPVLKHCLFLYWWPWFKTKIFKRILIKNIYIYKMELMTNCSYFKDMH